LLATYYTTVGFAAPLLLQSLHGHLASVGSDPYVPSSTMGQSTHFTRVDGIVDFDTGYAALLADLIPIVVPSFPAKYFSVWWRGYLQAPETALYRIHLETYHTSFIELQLNAAVLIRNEFQANDLLDGG
jgi:hypothetical protein